MRSPPFRVAKQDDAFTAHGDGCFKTFENRTASVEDQRVPGFGGIEFDVVIAIEGTGRFSSDGIRRRAIVYRSSGSDAETRVRRCAF